VSRGALVTLLLVAAGLLIPIAHAPPEAVIRNRSRRLFDLTDRQV
jgi:hypothetical protein